MSPSKRRTHVRFSKATSAKEAFSIAYPSPSCKPPEINKKEPKVKESQSLRIALLKEDMLTAYHGFISICIRHEWRNQDFLQWQDGLE